MEKNSKKSELKPVKTPATATATKPKPVAKSKSEKTITEVKATAKFIHVAPRKVRLVINQLPGLEAEKALNYLKFVHKISVRPVVKLINSAVANAENNFNLDKKDLYLKKIIVDDGPVVKRYRPRAHGRSTVIRQRTSHIRLILGLRPGAKSKPVTKQAVAGKAVESEAVKIVDPQTVKKEGPKISGKGPADKGKGHQGFFRGIFQRKTG